jgi:thioredoxin-related protein
MSLRSFALSIGAVVLSLSFVTAQEAQWIQNFADAKAKAKAEKKDLLIDFTGSDWCIWCKRLDKEVFADAKFQEGVANRYILVKLDFPNDKKLVTEEIQKQNEQLQKEWSIQGFPTIFLADAEGRPFAQTGYQQGGGAKYLEHMAELEKAKAGRDEHFTKAKSQQGVERAKHMAAGLDAMAEDLVLAHYQAELKEIIALDAKNEAKLKEKYEGMLDLGAQKSISEELQQKFGELAQQAKWEDADKLMDDFLTKNKGRKRIEQMATFHKAIVSIESKKDFDTALKLVDAAKAFDPSSEIGQQLDRIKKNIEKMRDDLKKGEGDEADGKKGEAKGGK